MMLRLLSLLWLALGVCRGGNYDYPQTKPDRQTMVHLFEWKWTDIANECEQFLQYYGYGAVQVSPPNEHIWINQNGNVPWWIRYQPVSYRLVSRSGNRAQFQDMVSRCNKVGVRIIVDAVINHMVGAGQSYGQNGVTDSDGSHFKGIGDQEYFPDVPFDNSDNFHDSHCSQCGSDCNIPGSAYSGSAWQVRMCRLVGLLDLDQSNEYVAQKIADYMNDCIGLGVAGFRVDATKHMWPNDLVPLYAKLKPLRSDIFGNNAQPFIVGEVIDYYGTEAVKGGEYTAGCGRVTNFKYTQDIKGAASGSNNWKFYKDFGPSWDFNWADNDVLNFVDNHDTQRGGPVLTYKNGKQYTMAVTYMLAWTYGYPRVMSSYYFSNNDQGPPTNGDGSTKSPTFNGDQTCQTSSGFVCEHRWPAIRRMAAFRSVCTGTQAAGIVTKDKGIAFQRGPGKGFFVGNAGGTWNNNFATGLPAGTYCDVISGQVSGSSCTGTTVTVGAGGMAQISVPYGTFALHVGQRLGHVTPRPGQSTARPPTQGPTLPPPVGSKLTVIFLHKATTPGQDLFIRGGISAEKKPGCAMNTWAANDPCDIRIQHKTKVPPTFTTYSDWEQGDNFLDWWGPEPAQGTHNGLKAAGTPMAYSTNVKGNVAYQPLNTFGQNYWILVADVDCSATVDGWFELKGYLKGGDGWEADVSQANCGGDIGGMHYSGGGMNHYAKCGALNVFAWNSNACTVNSIPPSLLPLLH